MTRRGRITISSFLCVCVCVRVWHDEVLRRYCTSPEPRTKNQGCIERPGKILGLGSREVLVAQGERDQKEESYQKDSKGVSLKRKSLYNQKKSLIKKGDLYQKKTFDWKKDIVWQRNVLRKQEEKGKTWV